MLLASFRNCTVFYISVSKRLLRNLFIFIRDYYRCTCWYGNTYPNRCPSKGKFCSKVVADIMSFDYVGALIGSVGFPLILLPTMGILTSSLQLD